MDAARSLKPDVGTLGADGIVHWRRDNGQQVLVFRPYLKQSDGRLLPGPGNAIDGLYAEGDNKGPWGLAGLGTSRVLHFRTDNEGQAPLQHLVLHPYLRQADQRFAGKAATDLNGRNVTTAPWGIQGPRAER